MIFVIDINFRRYVWPIQYGFSCEIQGIKCINFCARPWENIKSAGLSDAFATRSWPENDIAWKWPIYDRMMVPKNDIKRYKTIISSADGLSDRIIIRIKNVNFIFLVFMTLFYDILTQQIIETIATVINCLTVFTHHCSRFYLSHEMIRR